MTKTDVVDPIVLSAKICDAPNDCSCDDLSNVPDCVVCCFTGTFSSVVPVKVVYVTLGLFSIVRIERNVQMLIPAYDFCMPEKECTSTADNPCEAFRKINFPTNEFFPPRLADDANCGCSCK